MMFRLASRWRRKKGSRCSRETRLRESSMPQLPPRQAMRTPLTLITRYGEVFVSSSILTDGDDSPPGASDATQDFHPSFHSGGRPGEMDRQREFRACLRGERPRPFLFSALLWSASIPNGGGGPCCRAGSVHR